MQPDLQSRMAAAIRAGAAEAAPPPPIAGLRPADRIVVHVRTFRASLTAALAAAFPATQRHAGAGFFAYAAAQFLAAAPPDDPIVARYGAAFPAFLASFPPLAASPWLAELARLEWALHSLGDALPPPPPAAPAGADDVRALWSPTALLFASDWEIDGLLDEDDAAPVRGPTRLLLHAAAESVVALPLTEAAYTFFEALRQGRRLSAAIAAAIAADPGFDVPAHLRLAATRGCLIALNPA